MKGLMFSGRIKVLLAALALTLSGCAHGVKIHDRPISFSPDRVNATQRYIAEHYGEEVEDISIEPRIIVLHWTAVDDLDRCFEIFDRELLGDSRPGLGTAREVNVSIQFLVGQDGTIYRLMPETWMARHCIGLNYSAIGVENVGGGEGIDNLTDEQIQANIHLVRYLVGKYPTIRFLIGHMEYRRFEGHPQWRELNDGYRTDKIDPGERFMTAVREGVADLGLEGPP
jgi:N-acetyl-anhydromuramyl-L-alanine amidase AmpD